MGSLLKLSDFPDTEYIKICTFWTGFISRTLSVKSLMSYKLIISLDNIRMHGTTVGGTVKKIGFHLFSF